MIRDKFFTWPYGNDLSVPTAELYPVLSKCALKKYLQPEGAEAMVTGNLAEFISLECRNWNINPWWVMISAQREQSCLTAQELSTPASLAWLGFVGQDIGRKSAPGYYGIYPQVSRFVEQCAWLLGVEPSEKWPEYQRTRKQAARFRLGLKIPVEKDGQQIELVPQFAGEYLQLAYTPHTKVLETNELIYRRWVPLARQ